MCGIERYPPEPMSLGRALLLCIKALNDVIDRYQVRGYTDWHQTRAGPGCREKGEKHMCRDLIPIYHNSLMSVVTNWLQFWLRTSEGRPDKITGGGGPALLRRR